MKIKWQKSFVVNEVVFSSSPSVWTWYIVVSFCVGDVCKNCVQSTYLSNLWICSSLYGRPEHTDVTLLIFDSKTFRMINNICTLKKQHWDLCLWTHVSLLCPSWTVGRWLWWRPAALWFSPHCRNKLTSHTHTSHRLQISLPVNTHAALLPVLGVRPHLLCPAVGQHAAWEELTLDVLCRSFNRLQRAGDLNTHQNTEHVMNTQKQRQDPRELFTPDTNTWYVSRCERASVTVQSPEPPRYEE